MKKIIKKFEYSHKRKYKSHKQKKLLKSNMDEDTKLINYRYAYKKKFRNKGSKFKMINENNNVTILKDTIALLLFFASYCFFFLSLEKCISGDDICSQKWEWMKLKAEQLIISTILIIFLMTLIIYKIISKLHLLHFALTFTSFYYYSHSVFFHDHGGFNLIALFIVLFITLVLIFIIKFIFSIFTEEYKYKILSILILVLLNNVFIDPFNCDDWAKGLNNTYIENDINKHGCRIRIPKQCDFKLIGYTQDLSRISHTSCSDKKKDSKATILKYSKSPYINKNTTKFGFPLTNNEEGRRDGKESTVLKGYTAKNLIDMDKINVNDFAKPEYIVDFSKDPFGELSINLNYNESLSIERKKFEKNSNPYSDNVMILYLDSVSRVNSMRKLKKTLNFFEQFMPYKGGHNTKYPEENFHSFQFFKYHSFRGNTYQNFPKIFYGNFHKVKNFVRITKYYKQNGYVTCYVSDYCCKDNARTHHNLTQEEMADHQFLLCDPNAANFNFPKKRCLYGNINMYYFTRYIDQFWRKYENNRKLSILVVNDAHEGTLEPIKYIDEVIYDFLNSLYEDNLLKKSSIFLVSDHGTVMPSVYYLYDFFNIEIRLPMLYILVNDRKNTDYNQQYFNMHENQQILITAFDIYNTFGNILYGDNYINIQNKTKFTDTPKSAIGISLFEKINSKERKPRKYGYMDRHICI